MTQHTTHARNGIGFSAGLCASRAQFSALVKTRTPSRSSVAWKMMQTE